MNNEQTSGRKKIAALIEAVREFRDVLEGYIDAAEADAASPELLKRFDWERFPGEFHFVAVRFVADDFRDAVKEITDEAVAEAVLA